MISSEKFAKTKGEIKVEVGFVDGAARACEREKGRKRARRRKEEKRKWSGVAG